MWYYHGQSQEKTAQKNRQTQAQEAAQVLAAQEQEISLTPQNFRTAERKPLYTEVRWDLFRTLGGVRFAVKRSFTFRFIRPADALIF